jgi:predicted TIM-barrel fold metal-dependent hydrolase
MPPAQKIDVHSHFVPAKYKQRCEENGHKNPDGMPAVPLWTEEAHLEMMDSLNISKSILSITSPGTHLVTGNDELGRQVTRECNVHAADMKKRKPDRFGFFASTPLPDVQGTLAEIKYAFDELNADGVTLKTNHHGTYLGHKDFDPVFDELNRRKAIIFIHPTTPCMANGQLAIPLPNYPRPMFEFFFETARCAINLFMSGTVDRYPNITYILSHCGGALPPMIRRFSSAAPILGLGDLVSMDSVKERFSRQFYFDTAGWAFPEQIKGLLEYTTVDRILYGSDFPFTNLKFVTVLSEDHDKYLPEVFSKKEDQEALCYKNATRLLGQGK